MAETAKIVKGQSKKVTSNKGRDKENVKKQVNQQQTIKNKYI
jgi:hypothetical protein